MYFTLVKKPNLSKYISHLLRKKKGLYLPVVGKGFAKLVCKFHSVWVFCLPRDWSKSWRHQLRVWGFFLYDMVSFLSPLCGLYKVSSLSVSFLFFLSPLLVNKKMCLRGWASPVQPQLCWHRPMGCWGGPSSGWSLALLSLRQAHRVVPGTREWAPPSKKP